MKKKKKWPSEGGTIAGDPVVFVMAQAFWWSEQNWNPALRVHCALRSTNYCLLGLITHLLVGQWKDHFSEEVQRGAIQRDPSLTSPQFCFSLELLCDGHHTKKSCCPAESAVRPDNKYNVIPEEPVTDIVCYGIGKLSSCPIARYQFAFLLLLKELLKVTMSGDIINCPNSKAAGHLFL